MSYSSNEYYSHSCTLKALKTRMYHSIKRRSKDKCLSCLSKEEFLELTNKNSIVLEKLYTNWKANKYIQKLSPSVDRINPNLGYEPTNIQFLTHSENTSKGNRERPQLRTKYIA
jgi:hypothetical protein